MSLRRITLISSAALLTIGSAVTPVAIASADDAPPSHAGVVHTPRPVVTEVAPGSFTAALAGVGTFSFKVDPVTRGVTDLTFTPAAGSTLTAGTPKIRDNGLQVVLHSATAPKTAIEVEIEAEHGDDSPVVSVHREFDVDHRDRGHRNGHRGPGGNGSNGSNGGPPTTVAPTPSPVTPPVPVTPPTPPTTSSTTTAGSSNSSSGGPPSANGGNDAVDNDNDGDHDNGDQDRGGATAVNNQDDNDPIDNDQGNDGDHGSNGPSGNQGGPDSHGGSGSGGPGR